MFAFVDAQITKEAISTKIDFTLYEFFYFLSDHRAHLHRHQEISPEELVGLESVLRLIKCVAEKVRILKLLLLMISIKKTYFIR